MHVVAELRGFWLVPVGTQLRTAGQLPILHEAGRSRLYLHGRHAVRHDLRELRSVALLEERLSHGRFVSSVRDCIPGLVAVFPQVRPSRGLIGGLWLGSPWFGSLGAGLLQLGLFAISPENVPHRLLGVIARHGSQWVVALTEMLRPRRICVVGSRHGDTWGERVGDGLLKLGLVAVPASFRPARQLHFGSERSPPRVVPFTKGFR
mmetsp:Transcript_60956/g.160326  ORF Transcript_60956/g.160326 Transcript_60956/m.160326 type:complete len:206 (+) Transcript_60956:692-1309(+)